jgi:glycosyltransferase involved in cell wall biosynthesis
LIKILHLQTELNLACGVTRIISQIINNNRSDYKYHLISFGGDGLIRFESFSPIILKLNRHSVWDSLKFYFILLNYCKKHSIQIVHSHHRYFDTMLWFVKPFVKVKTITSAHSKVYGKKLISYKADKLIACSNNLKKYLINNFRLPENRIKVIYNFVDPGKLIIKINKEELKSQLKIDLDDYVIGFIGRINDKEKGINVLLKAFNLIEKTNSPIHLLVIGDGQDKKEAEKYCFTNNLKATLLSSTENIFDFYNVMDVIVLPSRVEAFGLVVIETGLIQKPFIGSNIDGIDEIVQHGKDGLLFESGNSEDLKNKILTLINNKRLADSLATNLNKKILDSFTIDKIIPKYEKLYLDVLSNN